jgi:ABC-type lipoprotein export system ATPase subunit
MSDPVSNGNTAIAEDVFKHFRSGSTIVRAVDGVTFSLPNGQMIALRGPSGCGKSTLLNLLGALDRPDAGRIVVAGQHIASTGGGQEVAYRRTSVGFVFQMFNLLPNLSALENVMVPMELAGGSGRKVRMRKAAALLERVGLAADKHERRPSRLSGGEQQRVAIARALANDPVLILADEPTANLDSATGAAIIAILRELAEGQRTVVIATHDDAIAASADTVIAMRDGKLEAGRNGGAEIES